MKKRLRAALPLAAATAVGVLIGYAIHAPGGGSTQDQVRNWIATVIIAIGVPVALIQLNLQRLQLRGQQDALRGQAEVNQRRDAVMDGQLREMEERARFARREQAEEVTLELVRTLPTSDAAEMWMANLTNGSHRPVRDAVCRLETDGHDPQFAEVTGVLADWKLGAQVARRIMIEGTEDPAAGLIRPGITWAYAFNTQITKWPEARVTARFTDDADCHWQLTGDLRLQELGNRDDW